MSLDGGARISTNAVFCGVSAPTTGAFPTVLVGSGSVSGIRSGKLTCEQVCGSLAAHMCSVDEYLRSAQLSLLTSLSGSYWIATGYWSTDGTITVRDCTAWSSASSGEKGLVIQTDMGGPGSTFRAFPTAETCNVSHSIMCCL
ncbi:MAG TPA: hypothetical protein VND93_26325 [Myxococcales bacterium]|nr:hypothetical protein [Myxococcales bacterium]